MCVWLDDTGFRRLCHCFEWHLRWFCAFTQKTVRYRSADSVFIVDRSHERTRGWSFIKQKLTHDSQLMYVPLRSRLLVRVTSQGRGFITNWPLVSRVQFSQLQSSFLYWYYWDSFGWTWTDQGSSIACVLISCLSHCGKGIPIIQMYGCSNLV